MSKLQRHHTPELGLNYCAKLRTTITHIGKRQEMKQNTRTMRDRVRKGGRRAATMRLGA